MDRKHHQRNSIKLTCGNNHMLYLYYIRIGCNINIIYKLFRFCSDDVVIFLFNHIAVVFIYCDAIFLK